jgi:muramoyltetrapeptide carboxypeptidase
VAVIPRTKAGLVKFRPVGRGSRVALVAPASPFRRAAFDDGVAELRRLGLDPVFDESIFETQPIVAGPAKLRAQALVAAATRPGVDAVVAVRGGYGSAEVLPHLDAAVLRRARTAVVGYSDITSLHAYLNGHVRLASVHGAMLDGVLSRGAEAYDATTWLSSLGTAPLGEVAPEGLEVIRPGEATGPILGGTLIQIAASLGTPYEFLPLPRYVLFIEEVGERPYRVRRLLMQLGQSGRLSGATGVVLGQMVSCDEPGGNISVRDVVREFFAEFPGPVIFGFPSGHTTSRFVSFPLGVETRVVATGTPRVVFTEAPAAE